jgi:hypothetical protein
MLFVLLSLELRNQWFFYGNFKREEVKIMVTQKDTQGTFLVRVDKKWYQILNQLRCESQMSFKSLVEASLSTTYMSVPNSTSVYSEDG